MQIVIPTGPMVIRVKCLDIALDKVKAFLQDNDDEYTINIYRHNDNKVYDLICDDMVELRIVIIEG